MKYYTNSLFNDESFADVLSKNGIPASPFTEEKAKGIEIDYNALERYMNEKSWFDIPTIIMTNWKYIKMDYDLQSRGV